MSGPGAAPAAVEVRDLTRRFGGLCAVDSVSIRVEPGARHAVIGSNGAGKSTLRADGRGAAAEQRLRPHRR